MFEGAERAMEWAPPDWWWAAWCAVAIAVGRVQAMEPEVFGPPRLGLDRLSVAAAVSGATSPPHGTQVGSKTPRQAWPLSSGAERHVGQGRAARRYPLKRVTAVVDAVDGADALSRWCVARVWEAHFLRLRCTGREWALGTPICFGINGLVDFPAGPLPHHLGAWAIKLWLVHLRGSMGWRMVNAPP